MQVEFAYCAMTMSALSLGTTLYGKCQNHHPDSTIGEFSRGCFLISLMILVFSTICKF